MNMMSSLPSLYPQSPVLDQERLNSIDPLENQQCRVCDEPAAGFHFGAFTCEGCKSFFGRSCNNQTVIQECRNNYQCIIDKKNRTACKACRLRKCLMVGMSKSGCRYGRRSNWFKIHCLMQKNAPRLPVSLPPSPYSRPPFSSSTPSFLQLPLIKPSNSRSPSPLNTSTETTSVHSSPSPRPDQPVSPPPSLVSVSSIISSAFPPRLPSPPPPSQPTFDLHALARLSPLFAANPLFHLAASPLLKMDFKQQLDILAERRAMFEKFKSEIESGEAVAATAETSAPIDLSCK